MWGQIRLTLFTDEINTLWEVERKVDIACLIIK